jgi:hypothetical protein
MAPSTSVGRFAKNQAWQILPVSYNTQTMNLPPRDRTIQLIRRMAALYGHFTHEVGVRPLVLPDSTFFPDTFSGDEKSVRKLVRRMKSYAGIDDIPIKVKVLGLDDLAPASDGGHCCGGSCHSARDTRATHGNAPVADSATDSHSCACGGACGHEPQHERAEPRLVDLGDQWLVQVPAGETGHDVILTTNLAKLMGLIFLLENLPGGAQIEQPIDATIEVTSTILGFGALLMEGSYLYSKSCGGPRIGRVTTLSCGELAILTALFVARGQHKSQALKRRLGTTQAAAYREAEALIQANRQITNDLASNTGRLVSGDFALRDSSSLWNRLFGKKDSAAREKLRDSDFDMGELEAMLASTPSTPSPGKHRSADTVHDELRALVDDALAESANEALPE